MAFLQFGVRVNWKNPRQPFEIVPISVIMIAFSASMLCELEMVVPWGFVSALLIAGLQMSDFVTFGPVKKSLLLNNSRILYYENNLFMWKRLTLQYDEWLFKSETGFHFVYCGLWEESLTFSGARHKNQIKTHSFLDEKKETILMPGGSIWSFWRSWLFRDTVWGFAFFQRIFLLFGDWYKGLLV